jgi:glycosyltransferase involved in cell wall biosynthesis
MAGPGVRYWEFARVLGAKFRVKLIVPPFVTMEKVCSLESLPTDIHICDNERDFLSLIGACDLIVTRGIVLTAYPSLIELNKPLVIDLYGPFLLEGLQQGVDSPLLEKMVSYEDNLEALKLQLQAGDFFICASEKQRDYWLGMLSVLGRVNPYTYEQDVTLRHLIDVVPFGLPKEAPQHTHSVLKGTYKTIAADDKVILWGGGIWSWLDALTLIKSMAVILQKRDDVKLFFMGIKRPNAEGGGREAVEQAIALSRELGLYDRYIFFNDWAPYEDRQNYLLEADIGVSLHLDHIETRFSFRTRLLDYLWAGLPTVATAGDVLSGILADEGLAYLVEPGDADGVAQAIISVLDKPDLRAEYAPAFRRVAERYRWEEVTQPLVGFCEAPYLAPDKDYVHQRPQVGKRQRNLVAKSWRALRLGGIAGLIRQGREYIRWQMKK